MKNTKLPQLHRQHALPRAAIMMRGAGLVIALLATTLQSSAALSLQVNDARIELANERIRLEIDKSSGSILKIFYKDANLIGRGKGYMQSNDQNGFLGPKQTELIIARNDDEVLDIGFAHQHDFAVDYEFHYVLRPGESGFYNYIVWGSKANNPGEHRLAQLNYALRLDADLFTHFADGANRGILPTPQELGSGKEVMDATIELADGTVYSKYNHAAIMAENHLVHGLMGASYGAWVIMPSHEHLNSVPFNTELTLHQTNTTPILLRHVQAAHHGSGGASFSTDGEPWQKWGGPWFFHFNHGGSMEVREQEAQALAEKMAAQWPFKWIKDERFAVERGTVRGKLIDQHGMPMANARVVISKAVPGEKPSDFQQLWRGYRFFGWTDANGNFELKNVWPDQYDLFAMQDEIPGRFASHGLAVTANKTTDTGTLTWQTPEASRRLWQVGTLDRSAAEFAHGDDFRRWGLWMEIAKEFPDEIISIHADTGSPKEIPHLLAAYTKKDGTPYQPVLKIEFNLAEAPAEQTASLLIALADAIQHSGKIIDLSLSLNGQPLAEVDGKFKHGGAIHRSGRRGWCQEATITFAASRLQVGNNVLEIRLKQRRKLGTRFTGSPHIAILLDALRLELK